MKKIAIIDFDLSICGGVEKVTNTLANELANYYEIYVISLNSKKGGTIYEFDKRIKYIEILQLENPRIRNVFLKSRKKIREILTTNNIDVVLEMGIYAGVITTLNSFFIKSKFIFCDHGALINQLNEKDITFMRRFTTWFCNHTVVLTDRTLSDYQKLFNINRNKVSRIYNWIDEKIYNHVKIYNDNSNLIISVGRIGNEKGFDMLIEVAIKLKEKNSNWCWHIYGDGPNYDEIKKKIDNNNLSDYVILKGQNSNIYDVYNKYSMLVLPSYREGLPLVLLEGKANKLPMVSFDIVTGPREIITNDKDGFLIEPYNIEKMANKINELLENRNLRKKFSDRTYENINKFKKDTVIKQWIELIENV